MKKEPTFVERIQLAAKAFSGGTQMQTDQTSKTVNLATESLTNLLTRLTPKKLDRILADADGGDIVAQHQLFSDVEDADEHIFTELSKRRRAVLSLKWDILPAVGLDGKIDAKAEKVAEEVKGLFKSIPDFEDMVLHLGDAIGHGFTALEIEWGYDGKFHVPVALHHRPAAWFCLEPQTRALRLRSQDPEGIELQPLGWVIHQHRSKAGWFARHGLFRVLMKTFILKQHARRGFAEFLEIHGLPLRMGKFPTWATAEDKSALLNGLRSLGRDAAAIIPEGMEVEFIEAVKASESPFIAMIEHCERGASKAILGGTLTSQADGKSSTNALGNVHNEVRHDILVSDAVQMASTITRQIILPLAVLNCGLEDVKLTPSFRFDTTEPEDRESLARTLKEVAPWLPIPSAWAYEKFQIPAPDEGEDVLELRTASAPAGGESDEEKTGKNRKKQEKARAELTAKAEQDAKSALCKASFPLPL